MDVQAYKHQPGRIRDVVDGGLTPRGQRDLMTSDAADVERITKICLACSASIATGRGGGFLHAAQQLTS